MPGCGERLAAHPPAEHGRWTFSADGGDAATLSVFTGAHPTPNSVLGCVDRQGPGPMVLPVPAKKRACSGCGRHRPSGAGSLAQLRFRRAARATARRRRLPAERPAPACQRRLIGPARSSAGKSRTLLMRLGKHGPLCGAQLTLTGPKADVRPRDCGHRSQQQASASSGCASSARPYRLKVTRSVLAHSQPGPLYPDLPPT